MMPSIVLNFLDALTRMEMDPSQSLWDCLKNFRCREFHRLSLPVNGRQICLTCCREQDAIIK